LKKFTLRIHAQADLVSLKLKGSINYFSETYNNKINLSGTNISYIYTWLLRNFNGIIYKVSHMNNDMRTRSGEVVNQREQIKLTLLFFFFLFFPSVFRACNNNNNNKRDRELAQW